NLGPRTAFAIGPFQADRPFGEVQVGGLPTNDDGIDLTWRGLQAVERSFRWSHIYLDAHLRLVAVARRLLAQADARADHKVQTISPFSRQFRRDGAFRWRHAVDPGRRDTKLLPRKPLPVRPVVAGHI